MSQAPVQAEESQAEVPSFEGYPVLVKLMRHDLNTDPLTMGITLPHWLLDEFTEALTALVAGFHQRIAKELRQHQVQIADHVYEEISEEPLDPQEPTPRPDGSENGFPAALDGYLMEEGLASLAQTRAMSRSGGWQDGRDVLRVEVLVPGRDAPDVVDVEGLYRRIVTGWHLAEKFLAELHALCDHYDPRPKQEA